MSAIIKKLFSTDVKWAGAILMIFAVIGGLVAISRSKTNREEARTDQAITAATAKSNVAAYENPAKEIAELKDIIEQMKVREVWWRRVLASGEIIEGGSRYTESQTETQEGKKETSQPKLPPKIERTSRGLGFIAGIGRTRHQWQGILGFKLIHIMSFDFAPYLSITAKSTNQVGQESIALGILVTGR